MPRILNDPTQAVSPNFEGPEWEFLRQAIIKTHLGNIPLTAEEAARQLREAWTKDNDTRVAAWNVQLEKDQAERDKRDRQAREVEEARRAKLENEWIEPRPAPYALNKINNLEYVELDYFTALRPSKNIRNDGDLSWEEMLEAKTAMLHFMAQFRLWPTAHAVTLKAFFVALERHPRRLLTNGKRALLLYQSRVRREWFHALARNEGFNIELINDDPFGLCGLDRKLELTWPLLTFPCPIPFPLLLHNAASPLACSSPSHDPNSLTISASFRRTYSPMLQIRSRIAQAASEIVSARPPSKRHCEWDHMPLDRTRSPSPSQAEPSRKRLRLR